MKTERLKYIKPFYCPYPKKKCRNCHYGQQDRCKFRRMNYDQKLIESGVQKTLGDE